MDVQLNLLGTNISNVLLWVRTDVTIVLLFFNILRFWSLHSWYHIEYQIRINTRKWQLGQNSIPAFQVMLRNLLGDSIVWLVGQNVAHKRKQAPNKESIWVRDGKNGKSEIHDRCGLKLVKLISWRVRKYTDWWSNADRTSFNWKIRTLYSHKCGIRCVPLRDRWEIELL